MQIIVDGREALIKKGSSFDLVAENRLFSGSDTFSLTITFPLRGCPRNQEIFGRICRPDVTPQDIRFDCVIKDVKVLRSGSLTITQVSETEVKTQFLEGRSIRNFSRDLDDIYINELFLGSFSSAAVANMPMEDYWEFRENPTLRPALPWVSADSGASHNFAVYDAQSKVFRLDPEMKDITCFRYLLEVTESILAKSFASVDLSAWHAHPFLRYLLVCNMVPASWDLDNYARVLPHWTVAEFIEKLEVFLRGEFDIDYAADSVTFRFSRDTLEDLPPVLLDRVLDRFSTDVKTDGKDCEWLDASPLQYKEGDHQLANIYSCEWLFKDNLLNGRLRIFDTMQQLLDTFSSVISSGIDDVHDPALDKIMYVRENGMHFMFRLVERKDLLLDALHKNFYALTPLNEFAPRLMTDDDGSAEDIDFVPACIDYTDRKHGYALFVDFGSFSEEEYSVEQESDDMRTATQILVENGKKENNAEYFSVINVAYYDGQVPFGGPYVPMPRVSRFTHWLPVAEGDAFNGLGTFGVAQTGLGIDRPVLDVWKPMFDIDRTRKFSFSFISDTIPDPRAVFHIRGKRYLCEKITATFTEHGMSQLLKGEFWQVLEDD